MNIKIYVTSDTFFGRPRIWKRRGFTSKEDMTEQMIQKWNSVVNPNDIVYHLGNFCWDPITCEYVSTKLNGKINFVLGEYDQPIRELQSYYDHLILTDIVTIPSLEVVLSHWPLADWPNRKGGWLHIHGNSKNKSDLQKELKFSANCELWNLTPIDLETLIEISNITKEEK